MLTPLFRTLFTLLLLITPPLLFAETPLPPFSCNGERFCSATLLREDGSVRNFRSKYESYPKGVPRHYYAAIALNHDTGAHKAAYYRDSHQIITINDARLGKNARTLFRGSDRVERLALNLCPNCEIALSFRDGCGAVAWSQEQKRSFPAILEYSSLHPPIKSSGANPQEQWVAKYALNLCRTRSYGNCELVTSLCTESDRW